VSASSGVTSAVTSLVSGSVTSLGSAVTSSVSGMTSLVSGVTSLVVTQVPPALNNISTLDDYFSKFGVIVNVQVCLIAAVMSSSVLGVSIISVQVCLSSLFRCVSLLL